jgi:nucleotide-binding universal stress UspA family protein
MATHGWHGLNRLMLGSETQKVLLQSNIPVLVCR